MLFYICPNIQLAKRQEILYSKMCKLIPDTRDNSNTDNYNTGENFFANP